MKNLTLALFLAGTSLALASCGKREPPKLENYTKTAFVSSYINGTPVSLADVDGDRKVDAIISEDTPHHFLFVAEGYKDKAEKTRIGSFISGYTATMTPEMRETASQVFQGTQELAYEAAARRWQLSQNKSNQSETK
jgi:hypothetical protein